MGLLVDGEWKDDWYDTRATGGRFVRTDARFRAWTRAGGEHPPESGRYHLYVSSACPWCHRVMIARALFGLEEALSMTVVSPWMRADGWEFTAEDPDPLFGARCLHQIYTRASPRFTGRVTVPVLWDERANTLVNNESSELVRMLDDDWRPLHTRASPRWYPEAHRAEIDAINAWIYPSINNACTAAASPPPRPPTTKPFTSCSRRSRAWNRCSRAGSS
jgi:putative glutathione S-transferase